jgi:hypothetical protein
MIDLPQVASCVTKQAGPDVPLFALAVLFALVAAVISTAALAQPAPTSTVRQATQARCWREAPARDSAGGMAWLVPPCRPQGNQLRWRGFLRWRGTSGGSRVVQLRRYGVGMAEFRLLVPIGSITFQSPFEEILAALRPKGCHEAGLDCSLHGRTEPAARSHHNFVSSNKMIINISYDSSVASAPTAFKAASASVVAPRTYHKLSAW